MTSQPGAIDGDDGAVPVACRLTAAALAAQNGRWERLAARAMTGRSETADGLRLSFRREPGVDDELRRLAEAENQCCPWADWTVRTHTGHLVLDVRSAGEGIGALHGMFTGLHPAPAADASAVWGGLLAAGMGGGAGQFHGALPAPTRAKLPALPVTKPMVCPGHAGAAAACTPLRCDRGIGGLGGGAGRRGLAQLGQ